MAAAGQASSAAGVPVLQLDGASMSTLHRVSAALQLDLHPSTLGDVEHGVHQQLGARLLRYSEDLQGVVMAYNNVRLTQSVAPVLKYFPFYRVDVRVDMLLFQPVPGSTLVGRVNAINMDFISLLVFGYFPVAIRAELIRPEFMCNTQDHAWVSRKKSKHQIKEGTEVVFRVAGLESGSWLQLLGSLQEQGTGALDFVRRRAAQKGPPKSVLATYAGQRGANGDPSGAADVAAAADTAKVAVVATAAMAYTAVEADKAAKKKRQLCGLSGDAAARKSSGTAAELLAHVASVPRHLSPVGHTSTPAAPAMTGKLNKKASAQKQALNLPKDGATSTSGHNTPAHGSKGGVAGLARTDAQVTPLIANGHAAVASRDSLIHKEQRRDKALQESGKSLQVGAAMAAASSVHASHQAGTAGEGPATGDETRKKKRRKTDNCV